MTKSERIQIEAIDSYLESLGLAKGIFKSGKNHGKYIYEDAVVGKITCSIMCTPKVDERSVKKSLTSFKRIFKQRLSEKFQQK